MMRDARLRAAGVGTLVPMLALATIAALACGGLQLGRGRRPEVLAQVGEQAFLDPLNTETPADMALKIQGILVLCPAPPLLFCCPASRTRARWLLTVAGGWQKKEAILLRKISQREKKHQHVQIDITAGQIGKMGPQGPKGYTGAQGFQGPQGDTGAFIRHRVPAPQRLAVSRSRAVHSLPCLWCAAGPPGIQGPRGIQGPNGVQVLERTCVCRLAHL
jgi:hypothetical protein